MLLLLPQFYFTVKSLDSEQTCVFTHVAPIAAAIDDRHWRKISTLALSPSILPMTYFLVFLSTLWQLVVCNRWARPGAQLFLRHVKDLYKFPQGCGRSGASTTQVNLGVKPDKQARKTFWKERGQLWILPEPQCGPGLELCLKHSSRKARLRILRLEDPKFNTGQGLLQLGSTII